MGHSPYRHRPLRRHPAHEPPRRLAGDEPRQRASLHAPQRKGRRRRSLELRGSLHRARSDRRHGKHRGRRDRHRHGRPGRALLDGSRRLLRHGHQVLRRPARGQVPQSCKRRQGTGRPLLLHRDRHQGALRAQPQVARRAVRRVRRTRGPARHRHHHAGERHHLGRRDRHPHRRIREHRRQLRLVLHRHRGPALRRVHRERHHRWLKTHREGRALHRAVHGHLLHHLLPADSRIQLLEHLDRHRDHHPRGVQPERRHGRRGRHHLHRDAEGYRTRQQQPRQRNQFARVLCA